MEAKETIKKEEETIYQMAERIIRIVKENKNAEIEVGFLLLNLKKKSYLKGLEDFYGEMTTKRASYLMMQNLKSENSRC